MLKPNKKAATFGTIVAVFGTVLIALGFAWLIAQNWHQINKWVKIFILISVTGISFFFGTFFRSRKHNGIGRSLHALGAIFYTLAIFLIAQIFSTEATLQGTAWLLLMSWAGVLLSAYLLDNSISLILSLLQFLAWLTAQYFAFAEEPLHAFHPAVLAFCLLSVGIILFGLYLWHKAKNLMFAEVYRFWTIVYLLLFTYLLSFQTFLPMMWPQEALLQSSQVVLLIALSFIAVISASLGIVSSIRRKTFSKKEILSFLGIVAILAGLIALTSLASEVVGFCSTKTCYQYQDAENCSSAPGDVGGRGCIWDNEKCIDKNEICWRASKSREACVSGEKLDACQWNEGKCLPKGCVNHFTKDACEKSEQNCRWGDFGMGVQACSEQYCYQYGTEGGCLSEDDSLDCEWNLGSCMERDPCNAFTNNYGACRSGADCAWSTGYNRWQSQSAKFPVVLWAVWIIINIAFIGIILAVIGYGTLEHLPKIINLGIIFFALDVITRYIGFIMDLWGYTSLAVIFITGGIILVFGGWGIEKWRRKLVGKTRTSATKE
ncbi:DUF2157 domain-containing protein [Candidatus Woesearchaeota archaeon]|nr:DUF2157 domain-containing protein [Candidatus Woesearchaeota archaeon]